MPPILLLGPQRHHPTVAACLEAAGTRHGPVALITAGWEDREPETAALAEHLGRTTVNLELHRRAEQVFAADPELLAGYRERRARIREQADLYRVRLTRLCAGLRALMARKERSDLLEAEIDGAIEDVRRLDQHQMERIQAIYDAFESECRPLDRDIVRGHRARIREMLEACEEVAIAGGHVTVLYNRLRLFGLGEMLSGHAIAAWSAGAMALTERIVLFHDDPPQGFGDPEVYGPGLGLCGGVVLLPHAHARLRLKDPDRVIRLARRLAPDVCVALDDRTGIRLEEDRYLSAAHGARRLTHDGHVVEWPTS